MLNLKAILIKSLKGFKKIAVIGIGSSLKSDDAAGIIIAEKLEKSSNPKLKVFIGSTAPENLTGEIIKYGPSHIIIIDSANMEQEPGNIQLIEPEDAGGVSFTSHMLPIKIMVDYLLESIKCEILIIGIQPKSLEFGGNLSKEVADSVKQITEAIQSVIGQ